MKFKQLLSWAFVSLLLFNISCSDDDFFTGNGEVSYSGILIANEGAYQKNNSSVDFLSLDLSSSKSDIYKSANNENTGDVLQSIGLRGTNAYLVMNNSNQITIVNRYNFQKNVVVTSNLSSPRYIAFSERQYYVTNNNFAGTYKLNIYNAADNTFIKSIPFERYAEKVVEASNNIFVQTDASMYNFTTNEMEITGHTISIVSPSSNAVSKVVTLPDEGEIKDLISYEGTAYALSSTGTESYIYKIAGDGTYTATTLTGIGNVSKLRADGGNFYFIDGSNKVYSKNILATATAPQMLFTAPASVYGFDVFNGGIFISNASFTGESTSYLYNASNGAQIRTFKTGIGTNGFYKN
ncbi:hypothetical protein [Epilithonimonas zeae]|uniref:hypothetical protein n=1 Tax=Epilithonimonas zeae TaxID=1416779 RepID=UPI00201014E9|nr:hypothetical protein [Epilithonimonas zeae]UQB68447.1 hypothetical protein KI430_15695 [Epilithonimonas zeae]